MNTGTIEDYRSAMYEVAEAIAPTWERPPGRRSKNAVASAGPRMDAAASCGPRAGDTVLELAAGRR